MANLCDLHTHSCYSDGSYTPRQLIKSAEQIGLGAIALTDHNTVSGLSEFMRNAEGKPLEAIPGIEFSTDYNGKELHIVALYVRPQYYGQITEFLKETLARKEEANLQLIDRLAKVGVNLDYGRIKAGTPHGMVNRALIAYEMTIKEYTTSIEDAFERYLRRSRGLYVPPDIVDAYDTIPFIKSIGSVAILGHPYVNLSHDELLGFLPRAVELGLDAMETISPLFPDYNMKRADEVADAFGLLKSGGSDFHGANKPKNMLGSGIDNNVAVPMEFLEKLKTRAR